MLRFRTLVAAIVILTIGRVASTYLTFSQVVDEPVHIAAGHQWLTTHQYTFDSEHPPLARALFALPFIGVKAQTPVRPSALEYADDRVQYGNDLLGTEDRYIHNLAKARRGNLPFLAVAIVFTALLGRRLFGDVAGVVAAALLACLPPLLAHAGLATTDLAAAATFAFALYALVLWLDTPTWPRTLLLGAALGIGLISKYSFIPFFGAAALIVLIVRWRRVRLGKLASAIAMSFVIVWMTFGFRIGTMRNADVDAPGIARVALKSERLADVPLPAPMFFVGLLRVKHHDTGGHINFLLGKTSVHGWWYYFPVALGVKTPIPFLLLALAGIVMLSRGRKSIELVLIALAILGIAMVSSINIGIRHILPIYTVLALIAAFGTISLWRGSRIATAALAGWLLAGSLAAHPDYLPWMNAFAGPHPERVLEDSNFDWGQDIWRLVRVLKKRRIERIGYSLFTNVRPSNVHYTNGFLIDPHVKSSGWIVISEQYLQLALAKDPTSYRWLTQPYTFERIGKTIRLYHL